MEPFRATPPGPATPDPAAPQPAVSHQPADPGQPVPGGSPPGAWRPVTPDASAPMSYRHALKTNLISGMRLFFGRRVGPQDFVATFDQLATLLIIALGYGVLLDWARSETGSAPQFYDAIYVWVLWLALIILLCALIARTYSADANTRKVLVVAASIAPWTLTLIAAIQQIPAVANNSDILSVLTIAAALSAGVLVVRAAFGRLNGRAVAIVLLGSLLIGRVDQYLYMDTHAWAAATVDHDERDYNDWYAAESLFFNEPERIDEAVDALAAERPGVSDVYYIGFAGDGSQRVFRREALFGQDVFARSMGAGSRSLELINDNDDRISFPIGSSSGLHYALQRVGARMNRDEDLLVLLLTSHGSQEEGLAVNNGDLPLNNLEPDELRRALDASGIQWRVIVVSACYAGTFIEPLKTDRTLVITAADADHTSFGCADDRELTYFGEAFLRDALPNASSLADAFEVASEAIRQRERKEKLTPSNPQIYLGAAMREKLAALGPLPLDAAN